MTYAFIIVVSVAITLKLLFLGFSMYVTLKQKAREEQANGQTNQKSLKISWKKIPSLFLPKSLIYPKMADKNYVNKS
ncbi:hypothetical protein O3G_MSEX002298 [Manduca sexta]|uniref:Uncharacterized protein n=1 Tax=Manduca sexta TaxID=7130 RepID=A0A921YPK4_MANSE|nr:hypothetical protein O3G_MSEX002298 [Manduca sexta]